MKWVKRVGLVLVAALAVFVFGWAPYWLARARHHPPLPRTTTRRTRASRPASFELPFEDVAFNAPDGVPLEGLVGAGAGGARARSSSSTA